MDRKKIINRKKCSIENCERPSDSRGWCTMHYDRWRKHKDPLKTLKKPNGSGSISRGFKRITVNGEHVREHRYLMEQHLGRRLNTSEVIHHLNGNKSDNRIENLIVLTQSQHIKLHYKQGDICNNGRPCGSFSEKTNCSIEWCNKPSKTRGFCKYHYNAIFYRRFKKYRHLFPAA